MPRIKSLLYKSGLNKDQMDKLLDYLGVDADVVWRKDFNTTTPYLIINLGDPSYGGTHFVAVDNVHKRYIDPLAMPPFEAVPKDYEYRSYGPQNVHNGHCGAFATLALLYSKNNEIDKYYSSFNIQTNFETQTLESKQI